MIDFKKLDEKFNEARERLERKQPLSKGAYNESPLASDHFMVKKSWEYFKFRVSQFDSEWKELVESKKQQVDGFLKRIETLEARNKELEDENQMIKALDQSIRGAGTEELLRFQHKSKKLQVFWENERHVFQKKIDELELALRLSNSNVSHKVQELNGRENNLKGIIESLKTELIQNSEKEKKLNQKWINEVSQKDDIVSSLQTKVDLLRGEVDRRESILRDLQGRMLDQEKVIAQLERGTLNQNHLIKDSEQEVSLLKEQLSILQREKENLRVSYQREQAEWRELWDRGRETWERQRKAS